MGGCTGEDGAGSASGKRVDRDLGRRDAALRGHGFGPDVIQGDGACGDQDRTRGGQGEGFEKFEDRHGSGSFRLV